MFGIPWTAPQNTSAEVIRFGFNRVLNEDWSMTPIFDLGAYQSVAMDMRNNNSILADIHLRFDWTDTYYVGLSTGIIVRGDSPSWGVAFYTVKNFSF
jgi:hypothetical protein